MHRFFVDSSQICNDKIFIVGEDVNHIKVLRIKQDELIEICDGLGTDYICTITRESKDEVVCTIVNNHPSFGENDYQVTLYQGYPKSNKLDDIIQKSTELGIHSIVPFYSERTIKKPTKNDKIERLNKIAYSAAKQSKRGIVPIIRRPIQFCDIIDEVAQFDLFFVAYEDEHHFIISQLYSDLKDVKRIAFLIGPEGGLTFDEVKKLTEVGARAVSLGSRILRTETAGMAVMAQLNLLFEMRKNNLK